MLSLEGVRRVFSPVSSAGQVTHGVAVDVLEKKILWSSHIQHIVSLRGFSEPLTCSSPWGSPSGTTLSFCSLEIKV